MHNSWLEEYDSPQKSQNFRRVTSVGQSSQMACAGLARGVRTNRKTSEEAEQQEQMMGTDKWGYCRETQEGTGPGECVGA